ncbi:glycoside hydrolase superfamily [Lactifluus subvellereus]|nr:glycoside hydrolase superfamily [Lactifluus subvellereus]
MSAHPADDFTPEYAPPRFLGTIDGQNGRDSLVTTSTHPQSDGLSSVYALNNNPDSLRGSPHPGSAAALASPFRDDPRSPGDDTFDPSAPLSTLSPEPRFLSDKQAAYADPSSRSRRRRIIAISAIAALIIIIAAIVVPVVTIKHHGTTKSAAAKPSSQSSTAGAASPSSTGSTTPKSTFTGGDGSTVKMEDGTTFVYRNAFGGNWYWNPDDPFNNSARAQSWTPALNEPFNYGIDHIRGVNLGGWLTLEPFITPSYYQKYGAVDEWTLSVAMAADAAAGGLTQLENHYKTFITEQDFAEIASAGLNFVRIPLPFWAIETRANEPFLAKTAWKYFLKAIQWARKYGLRINLDFHALPGSQNGWNHSGRLGTVNFLYGPMGYANAQRTLDYIRILAEFISQPQYSDVVAIFGIANEPFGTTVGQDVLTKFYFEAYNIVRTASGIGAGKGPMISYHDGFVGMAGWAGWLPTADRIAIDTHPYLCFGPQNPAPMAARVQEPCGNWGATLNTSMGAFGMSIAGEWSLAINDCGTFVNGAGMGARWDGTFGDAVRTGDCGPWLDYGTWSQDLKTQTQQFALASMDALQNWFFWTWKIGPAADGKIESPSWSYQLGFRNGWMPPDPRAAAGVCGNANPWQPPLPAVKLGGAGAGQIPANLQQQYAWPPAAILKGGPLATIPQYQATGQIPVLASPVFTSTSGKPIDAGTGWNNPQDKALMAVPNPNCPYLTPWQEDAFVVPPLCPAQ